MLKSEHATGGSRELLTVYGGMHMFVCRRCRSNSIKSRSNIRFGKNYGPIPVRCKKCGSTEIDPVEVRENRRRGWSPQGQNRGPSAPAQGQRPAPKRL